ncbi:type VII toxin-antitoxin system MntA family adenylyltransferase antitoxin [Halosimplex sp. TS25]|uniref:type VII toxin-antitoxin system MntA family adenylyltransferase antitoxin n=1 Tax=Halosimplex rarum TaxID=3396619 RepID=UPI0039ED15D1
MEPSGERTVEGVDTESLRDYLAQTDVVFAILFGSRARGTARESSDFDLALRFPAALDDHERFRRRNRIDAAVQEYAADFVDVSDIESLPTPVAYAALRDGVLLAGDRQAAESYYEQIKAEYEETAGERERERRSFIDRLARGDV